MTRRVEMAMSSKRFKLRRAVTIFAAILTCYITYYVTYGPCLRSTDLFKPGVPGPRKGQPSPGTLDNLALNADQCGNQFPDLTEDIAKAVARGPFNLSKYTNGNLGDVQGKIKDGKLYMISVAHDVSQSMTEHRVATLNQLYRAIITSPEPLPDTHFSLSVHDNPRRDSWVYSRPTAPEKQKNYWLMPPFSGWAWNSPLLGTPDDILARTAAVEAETPRWADKIDRAVWRGTTRFNPIDNVRLRNNLYLLAKDKPWADVAQLSYPHGGGSGLHVEDHCRYRYVLYTEGVTYSGRLPYQQACASVLLTTPLLHHTHSSPRLRPLFSSTLDLPAANFSAEPPAMPPLVPSSSAPDAAWPRSWLPHEANAVFVAPDWSDLEAVIQWLRDHEDVAAGIAARLRGDFALSGFLSPAAEACYWRALIRGWASVAVPDVGDGANQWGKDEGVRFEEYVVRGDVKDGFLGIGG